MLNALANLAIRRSRAVVVTAVLASVVAGALGRGRRRAASIPTAPTTPRPRASRPTIGSTTPASRTSA